jgi:hypothetical protein
MSIESIALNTYFAVETSPLENVQTVAHRICATADEVKTLFHRLEVLDAIQVGGRKFIRCRSDVLNPFPMLELIYTRHRRSVIIPGAKGYEVKFLDGRMGPVTNVMMHSTAKLGQRVTYRGPKVKFWARQFE